MLCASLGAHAQAISYPSNPDMDNDGMVGIDDLFQVLAHFGEFVGVGADAPVPDYSLFPEFEGTVYQLWMPMQDEAGWHFRSDTSTWPLPSMSAGQSLIMANWQDPLSKLAEEL